VDKKIDNLFKSCIFYSEKKLKRSIITHLKINKMKKISILCVVLISMSSCSEKLFRSLGTNLDFSDQELNARGIDTASVIGAYAALQNELRLYFEPDFAQDERVEGGKIIQRNMLSGDFLLVPLRIFVTDKKGRKIRGEKGLPLTAPFLSEITGIEPGFDSRYSKVLYTVESPDGMGTTLVFIPVAAQGPFQPGGQAGGRNSGLRIPDLGNQSDIASRRKGSQGSQNPYTIRYQLQVTRCGGCNQEELLSSGFKVDENDFIYFVYQGQKYLVSLTADGRQAFVDAASAEVQIDGLFLETENEDTRKTNVAAPKILGRN
jgi:hypothetical protein